MGMSTATRHGWVMWELEHRPTAQRASSRPCLAARPARGAAEHRLTRRHRHFVAGELRIAHCGGFHSGLLDKVGQGSCPCAVLACLACLAGVCRPPCRPCRRVLLLAQVVAVINEVAKLFGRPKMQWVSPGLYHCSLERD